jgi:hypothetical protein
MVDGWSGRGFQGDAVAKGMQLAHVVADLAVGVDPSVVIARTRSFGPPSPGDTPTAFTQKGRGSTGTDRCLAEHP